MTTVVKELKCKNQELEETIVRLREQLAALRRPLSPELGRDGAERFGGQWKYGRCRGLSGGEGNGSK